MPVVRWNALPAFLKAWRRQPKRGKRPWDAYWPNRLRETDILKQAILGKFSQVMDAPFVGLQNTHRGSFCVSSGRKLARSCASLTGFSRMVAASTGSPERDSDDPETRITGTPCLCSRAIKP